MRIFTFMRPLYKQKKSFELLEIKSDGNLRIPKLHIDSDRLQVSL
ncbi:hypothetical protein D1AOALGA4SA_1317 [Olavius algarvensis Delta 1 endosymbiont]|nr:hypothetical protein D1AOALGA4SA_1317 [Olavius algarvensis Delta 1 endosymbiont]